MGLYLCIIDDNEEDIEGVDVGFYSDYGFLINAVVSNLEGGKTGSKYPTLTRHHDSDGIWSVKECSQLKSELISIAEAFKELPPVEFDSEWQTDVANSIGLVPRNLFECFIDVDGEPLFERLVELCGLATERNFPIIFQ